MDKDAETLLNLIEQTRSVNNVNWMGILRLAMKHAPEETKGLLRAIRASDQDIAYYTEQLSQ